MTTNQKVITAIFSDAASGGRQRVTRTRRAAAAVRRTEPAPQQEGGAAAQGPPADGAPVPQLDAVQDGATGAYTHSI